MNLRIKFTKLGYLKYISHLDLMRLFQRAFKRANVPIKYSQGFNPQPKLSIAQPLALGIESLEEFMEIELFENVPEEEFINRVNKELPEGIKILDVQYTEDAKSIFTLFSWSYYEIKVGMKNIVDIDSLEMQIQEWLEEDEIIIKTVRTKKNKTEEKYKDIKPLIGNVTISRDETYKISDDEYLVTMKSLLKSGDNGNLKAADFLKGMSEYIDADINIHLADVKRLKIFTEINGKIDSIM